jgi:alkylation response protein AidB-like acyl-CoA dehydrogenase
VRFALSEDQAALRDAVRELLARECPPATIRAAWPGPDEDPGRPLAVWRKLATMGVLGAAVPESAGGLGLGACDVVPLLEECGRVALPLPIAETAFVAAPALAESGDPDGLLEGLIGGETIVAAALDGTGIVPYAGRAGALLLGTGPGEEIVVAGPDAATAVASIDGARTLGRTAGPATGAPLDLSPEARLAAWDRGVLGTAAQLIGLGRTLLAMSTGYVRERRQFGVPVGSFQAVKHRLADALLALEFAAPAVLRAAWSLDRGADEARRDIAMAKSLAGDAAELVAGTALQVHGAIAYTTEYDFHLYAKRVWASARTWGDSEWQRTRVAAALGLGHITDV